MKGSRLLKQNKGAKDDGKRDSTMRGSYTRHRPLAYAGLFLEDIHTRI